MTKSERHAAALDLLDRLELIDRASPDIQKRLAAGELDLRGAVEELNRRTALTSSR